MVWWYLLEVTYTVTEFDPRIGHVEICLLTVTLTLTLTPILILTTNHLTLPPTLTLGRNQHSE